MRHKTTSLFALGFSLFFAITSLLKAQFTELHHGKGGQSDSIPQGVNVQWLKETRDGSSNRNNPEQEIISSTEQTLQLPVTTQRILCR